MNDVFGSAAAGFVVFLLILVVIVLLVAVVSMNMKMNRLQRRYNLFMKGSDGQSVEKAMTSRLREIGKLRSRQEKSREDLIDLQHQYNSMLCKYGIVKYDAFEDVGGKMSFALAMLDQNNTGFVLNAIHSRDNCYLYLKDVVKGTSYIMLSDEEIEALRRASRFGEAEAAAASTRRKKRDEERARKEAAEEAKAEKRAAAQAAERRKQPETPEEAELRMLEEIIARSESKTAAAQAAQAVGTSETPRRAAPAADPSIIRQQAGQAAAVQAQRRAARPGTSQETPGREAGNADSGTAQVRTELNEAMEAIRQAAGREPAAQTVRRPQEPDMPAAEIQTPTRRAARRRIDEGMPELTD